MKSHIKKRLLIACFPKSIVLLLLWLIASMISQCGTDSNTPTPNHNTTSSTSTSLTSFETSSETIVSSTTLDEHALSETERSWFSALELEISTKTITLVPNELLLDEKDSNTSIYQLFDASGSLVAIGRHINSAVSCLSGSCLPVEFVILLTPSGAFMDTYNVPDSFKKFRKNIDGVHSEYTQADLDTLKGFLTNPPSVYASVTDVAELVEATSTFPTKTEYVPYTVHGSVFTTYLVLEFLRNTQEIATTLHLLQ